MTSCQGYHVKGRRKLGGGGHSNPQLPRAKVIIEKSRGEASPMGQDTIENVSLPIKNLKRFFQILYVFDTSK